jgi:hypothetical protein
MDPSQYGTFSFTSPILSPTSTLIPSSTISSSSTSSSSPFPSSSFIPSEHLHASLNVYANSSPVLPTKTPINGPPSSQQHENKKRPIETVQSDLRQEKNTKRRKRTSAKAKDGEDSNDEDAARKTWTSDEVKKLLLYLKENVDCYKRLKSKFYTKAALHIGKDTKPESIKNKLANLVKGYQKYKREEEQSGGGRPTPPEFLDELEDIFGDRPNINPAHLTSNTSDSPKKASPKKKNKHLTGNTDDLAAAVTKMSASRDRSSDIKRDLYIQKIAMEQQRLEVEKARIENERRLKEKELELKELEMKNKYELEKMRLELELAKVC